MSAAVSPRPPASGAVPGKGPVYKGKWRVLHPHTETDRSYVFLGTPLQGGGPVAIKVLKDRRARDARFMKLHDADMQAARNLPRHPALVPVLDAGWTSGRYVVVSQLAPGEPLSSRLQKPRPIPYPVVLAAARQIAALLSFANDAELRFRNIEPEHLLLDEEARQVRLLRFSMPRSARLGIEPPRGLDPDLHLAGSLLFRMLCGSFPTGRERDQTAELLADDLKDRLARSYPEVSPQEAHELATLYIRTSTRDQARRFGSYAELDTALAHLEECHRPLQEERRRREKEERRSSLLSTAYDTVLALQGGPRREGEHDDDARERRIQWMLMAAGGLALLALLLALFR